MKKFYFLMIAILFAVTTSAQSPIFEKGNTAINIGVGLGIRGLPVEVSAIYGIVDDLFRVDGLNLGVGGYFGFSSWKAGGLWTYGGYSVLPGVRGEVHYSVVDNLDFFGGVLLGLRVDKWDGYYFPGTTSSWTISTGAYVGAKYFVTENFGFYASAGYGITYLSGGIALQF
jgi:hypothetical protein